MTYFLITIILILVLTNIQQFKRSKTLEERVEYVIREKRKRNGLPL